MLKIFLIVCISTILAACSDPHDTKVPTDISEWAVSVKPALEKLAPDEKALFAQYTVRHTIGAATGGLRGVKADPIPEGMTIGKAIAEQRNYAAQEPGSN